MSSNNLLTPSRRRRYEALKEASYSVDDSDSVESTPKSILKCSNTPLREEYENDRTKTEEIYTQEDTMEFTYNSEEDLFAQSEPPTDLFDSPVHFNTGSSLSILSGSPSDRRRRRLDIFGTPPGQRSNYISYENNSDEEENPDLDISHFLVEPKNSKNPFAVDDDSEDMPSTHDSFDTEIKERSIGEGLDSIHGHNQDILITRNPFDDESKTRDTDGDLEFTRDNNFEDTPNTYSSLEDERETKDKTNAFEFFRDYSPDNISRTYNSLNDERKQRDIRNSLESSREYNINDILDDHSPSNHKSEMRNMVRETKDYLELEHNSESERNMFEIREKEIEEQYEEDVDMDVDLGEEYSNNSSHLTVTRHQLPPEDDLDMQTTQEFERDDLDMQMTQEFKKDDSNMQITQESEKDDLDMQMTQEFKEDVLDMQMTQEFKEDELDMQITQEFKKDNSNMQITQESEKDDLDIQEHAYNKTQISSQDMSMQFTQEIAVLKRPSIDTTISIVQPSSEHRPLQNESLRPDLSELTSDYNRQITIDEYFSTIGITFQKEISLNDTRIIEDMDINYIGPIGIAEQAAAAFFTIPQLELYQKTIQEMQLSIRTSKEVEKQIKENVNKNIPSFFFTVLDAEANTRRAVEQRYRKIKQYIENRILEEWYEWWGNILEVHIKKIEDDTERLEKDKQNLRDLETQLRQQLPHLLDHQKNINEVLGKAREKERKQHGFDHIKLVKAQTEIEHQQRSIESLDSELNELEEKNSKAHEKIKKLEIHETRLKQQIFQTKQEIEDNKKVTEEDLKAVQKEYFISCTIRGWELLREDENTLEIMMGEDLKMKIDREGLQNKELNALSFQISHKKEKELGHLITLKRGLNTLSNNETNLDKVIRRAVTYWNKLELIVDVIKDSRLHFRVQIDPLEAVEDVDSGIRYLISASNVKKETSIVVNFNIRVKDMRKFPYVDMASIGVNVNHGHIIDAKNRFQNLMKNNGLLDIVDSVNSLFE
ncbi:unnamed protein product [Rhizopus stolonifer]